MSTDNNPPDIEESFARYRTYKLKFPYQHGTKLINELKIEVPNGAQVLAMTKAGGENGSTLEMLAELLSQCAEPRLTPKQILEFKYPDLKELDVLCNDFL